MKDKNEYGFYSSAYVYDRLSSTAIMSLKKSFPDMKDKVLFITDCKVFYQRPLCDLDKIRIFTGNITQTGNDSFVVENAMRKHSSLVAYGFFSITTNNARSRTKEVRNDVDISGDNDFSMGLYTKGGLV